MTDEETVVLDTERSQPPVTSVPPLRMRCRLNDDTKNEAREGYTRVDINNENRDGHNNEGCENANDIHDDRM